MGKIVLFKSKRLIRQRIQYYNEAKYWKCRVELISVGTKVFSVR